MTDRYEVIESSTGLGGYGRVDKAMDTALQRPVAIKTLDPLFTQELKPEDIERFHREARALAQLSHPNIPAIYDIQFTPEESEFKIIFEWVDGQTLREHLMDRGVLSLDEARTYLSQVCSALVHAHERNLVHRDVKPSNIVLNTAQGSCYLVDFGIALRKADLSRITTGTPIGTGGYMSPEQEKGEELTPASDVFSLGIVLYECLAGSKPSVAGYRSLTLHNESIPPTVDALVRDSLNEVPQRRPQTASEFIERFVGSLRPHASFATTLADGSLHEIQLALSSMTPEHYSALPPGQRMLVMTRLADLASVDEERLRRAVAALLVELVRLAHPADVERYRTVVNYGFDYGFEKHFSETWVGDGPTRSALVEVSRQCNEGVHALIAGEAIERASRADVTDRPGWHIHDLRMLLQNLLINPVCAEDSAVRVGEALQHLNSMTHLPLESPR